MQSILMCNPFRSIRNLLKDLFQKIIDAKVTKKIVKTSFSATLILIIFGIRSFNKVFLCDSEKPNVK